MTKKNKQKEISKDHKKNYEKEKKNSLRFLANRKFLTYLRDCILVANDLRKLAFKLLS